MDTIPKCGGCLWYVALSGYRKLGECKNTESASYWNQGDDRETVQIAPDAKSCRYYRSARMFLVGDTRTVKPRDSSLITRLCTGLYQLVYPLVLTGVFFFYAFRGSPERYDSVYTRTETEKLSL